TKKALAARIVMARIPTSSCSAFASARSRSRLRATATYATSVPRCRPNRRRLQKPSTEGTLMITTPFTQSFELQHPIVLGPMGGVAGGRLAAAVSNAGGLGLVGGGYGDLAWLKTELALVKELAVRPWGVGFITWNITEAALKLALEAGPSVVMLSFGDPGQYAPAIKAAGCRLICQVQDVAGALLAQQAGADVIVAQGTEGGGHGGSRATMALLPAVI